MKSDKIYLQHILNEIQYLEQTSKHLIFEKWMANETLKRAFTRSLEIIGEAVKNISPPIKEKYSDIEWKKIAGLRDKVIHEYFDVNWNIVWDVIEHHLPQLKTQVESLLLNEFTEE